MMYDQRVEQKPEAVSPDLYLKTPKSIVLALIKLIGGLFAIYFAYLVLADVADVSDFLTKVSNKAYPGGTTEGGMLSAMIARIMTSEDMSYDAYLKAIETITDIVKYITAGVFALIAVEGLASALLVFTRQGAPVIRAIRTIRLIASVIGLIWTIYYAGDLFINLAKTASKYDVSMSKLLEGSYYNNFFQFLIYEIMIIAAPIVLIIHHKNVLNVMERIQPEARANQMTHLAGASVKKTAIVGMVVCGLAVLAAVVHMLGDGTEFVDERMVFGYETIQLLFYGDEFVDLLIPLILLIKFVLIYVCSGDYETAHYRAYNR